MDIRCAERLHFKLIGDIAEVKCKSKRCGAGSGNVILHRFNIKTGDLIETLAFQDPLSKASPDKEEAHGSKSAHCAAVRSA